MSDILENIGQQTNWSYRK